MAASLPHSVEDFTSFVKAARDAQIVFFSKVMMYEQGTQTYGENECKEGREEARRLACELQQNFLQRMDEGMDITKKAAFFSAMHSFKSTVERFDKAIGKSVQREKAKKTTSVENLVNLRKTMKSLVAQLQTSARAEHKVAEKENLLCQHQLIA